MSPTRAAVRLAVAQSGVVRRGQLYDLGLSRATLLNRIRDGLWEPRGRNVLVYAGTADGLLTASLVAAHSVFPDGVLTGFSALAVQGLVGVDPWNVLDAEPMPWIRLAQHRRVPARVIRQAVPAAQRLSGVPVAGQDVVITDLLRFLPVADARLLLFRVAQTMGSAALLALLDRAVGGVGRAAGVRQVRDLMAELETGAHSDAEQQLLTLLRDAGVTGFVANYPVLVSGRRYVIDVAFPESRLAVEVDGRAFHTNNARFQGDRTRQNLLVAARWRVLRFTWEDLTVRPEHVLTQIMAMLMD